MIVLIIFCNQTLIEAFAQTNGIIFLITVIAFISMKLKFIFLELKRVGSLFFFIFSSTDEAS